MLDGGKVEEGLVQERIHDIVSRPFPCTRGSIVHVTAIANGIASWHDSTDACII